MEAGGVTSAAHNEKLVSLAIVVCNAIVLGRAEYGGGEAVENADGWLAKAGAEAVEPTREALLQVATQ